MHATLPFRLTELDRITIDDVEYVFDCELPGETIFIDPSSRRARPIKNSEIIELHHTDRMIVEPGYYHAKAIERRSVMTVEALSQIGDKSLADAMNRKLWCDLVLRAKAERNVRREGGIELMLEKIAAEYRAANAKSIANNGGRLQQSNSRPFELTPPPLRTLNDWLGKYRKADFDISGLIDKYSTQSKGKTIFTDEERNLHARFVLKYASRTKPSIRHLHRRMKATFNRINRGRGLPRGEGLRWISETYLREKINELPDFFKMAGREGERKARLYYQIVRQGASKGIPLQRVEADEYHVDLQTILVDTIVWKELTPEQRRALSTVRLWFSGVIDVATKCILAFRVFVEDPKIESALATFDMTTRDKTALAKAAGCKFPWEMCGQIQSAGMDSATWFVADAVKGALHDAGCTTVYPPSGEPYLRGTIERFFRTIAFLGLQDFCGRTFGNVVEKGDAKPEQEAVIRTDLLAQIFTRLIVDVYHNTPHTGLWGATPRQAWLELTKEHKPAPAPVGHLRRNIYGTPAVRKITKEGIVNDYIQYQSLAIQQIRRDDTDIDIDIKYDRFDLSEITLIWKDGMLRVPATLPGLKNVTIWQWAAAKKRLRIEDRENLLLTEDAIADALEWAAQQHETSLEQLERASPILTDERYHLTNDHRERFIRTADTRSPEAVAVRQQAPDVPELALLFGRAAAPIANAPEVAKPDRTLRETNVPKPKKVRKANQQNSAADEAAVPPDDEFGILD